MSIYQDNPILSQLTLGKTTDYRDNYDPALLQPVPRLLNRQAINIDSQNLPFSGEDIWTLYELSWLNSNGLPQVAIGEVRIPATSKNIIESKSFKLYLNSFNQTKFDSWATVEKILRRDLQQCAGESVNVRLLTLNDIEYQTIRPFAGESIDEQDIVIDSYQFDADLLKGSTTETFIEEKLVSHLLKSNCLITNQPDWGSLQIHYYGPRIDRKALLRYIVSFRHHNEFHEQCVERIFNDLLHYCQPQKLMVYARYTRRGGLDINPFRTNAAEFTPAINRLIRQ